MKLRVVGMTQRRTTYGVSIDAPGAAVGAYLQPYATAAAAHAAARRWIDAACDRTQALRPSSASAQ